VEARCGRCGRMMRVFYGQAKGHAHRYQCRGNDAHVGAGMCIGIGGLRIDRAIASQLLEAVSDRAGKRRCSQPIRSTDHTRRSLRRSSGNLKVRTMRPHWLPADTSLWIHPNAMWPASLRPAGTALRNASANWSGSVTICVRPRRPSRRSIVRGYSNLLMICRQLGTQHRPIRAPSNA
jgi:hypothetical protein